MAEWTKATVLKTVVAARSPGVRIPLPPPQQRSDKKTEVGQRNSGTRGGARVVEWDRLLSGCGVNSSTQGSNPCLPASYALVAQWIERLVADQKVAGSNPVEGTRDRKRCMGRHLYAPRLTKRGSRGASTFSDFWVTFPVRPFTLLTLPRERV